MNLAKDYIKKSVNRHYLKLNEVQGLEILHTIPLDIIANFSFVPQTQERLSQYLTPWGIDVHGFCIYFDGATFEYYPKQLKVIVYIFEDCYSFDFTKPQWLGQPLSKNTEAMLLGKAPK